MRQPCKTAKELYKETAALSNGTAKNARITVENFFKVVGGNLSEDVNCRLTGLISFMVTKKKERKGINPKTKEVLTIPARRVCTVKAGQTLKNFVK